MVCSFFFLLCPFCIFRHKFPENCNKQPRFLRGVLFCVLWLPLPRQHRCAHNGMSYFLVRWFTPRVIQLRRLSWPWETQIPVVEAERWAPPPPQLVYLSSHNAPRNRRQEGELRLFSRTTAGILQPNGHVFTLGCFLISQCNGNNIKKKSSGLLFSKQSNPVSTIGQQFSKSLDVLSTEWQMDIDWQDTLLNDAFFVDYVILDGTGSWIVPSSTVGNHF